MKIRKGMSETVRAILTIIDKSQPMDSWMKMLIKHEEEENKKKKISLFLSETANYVRDNKFNGCYICHTPKGKGHTR